MSVKGDEAFPRRAEAARQTRAALVAAAAALFVERGYVATTVVDIATRAGVGRATVFTSVPGGKPELLSLARDHALAGDDEPVPVPQRPWFLHAMAATCGDELLRRQSRNYRMIHERAARLEEALAHGAAAVEELRELHGRAQRQRYLGCSTVIGRLSDIGELREGLTGERGADVLFGLASPALFLMFTRERGWNGVGYEEWLADALARELLSSTSANPASGRTAPPPAAPPAGRAGSSRRGSR